MTHTFSKSRQQAENAFNKAQSQLFARARAAEELASLACAREEKTLRLRQARLAQETQLRATAGATLVPRRAKKV
jgi:hypothetical protein